MIVRPRPSLWRLFFILRGSIVPRIVPQLLLVGVLSTLVVLFGRMRPDLLPKLSGGPFALIGIALSIFLSFRNSACYDRWWEARRHWGALIVASRTLARQTLTLGLAPRRRLLFLAIAFAQSLVLHLRPGGDRAKAEAALTAEDAARFRASVNPPDALLQMMGEDLARLRAEGRLSDILYQTLDRTIDEMTQIQAACERIRSTLVPFGYTLLLHRTAYIFCFMLPFGFADAIGWATPFAVVLVAYTFFGLDVMSDELEEPFGVLANDLPIAALADTIEIGLRESLGETNLPPLPAPKDFVLM